MKTDTISQHNSLNQHEESINDAGRWLKVLIVVSAVFSLLFFMHATTVRETISVWNRSNTYKFAWIVLPTLGYLFWHNRQRFQTYSPEGCYLGVITAILCAGVWLGSDLLNISVGRQLALVGGIYSIILASVGLKVFRVLLPFLALMFFLVPLGDFMIPMLKSIALWIVEFYAELTGIPFKRDGFALFIDTNRYVIIDYCTGLPYVLVGMFFGMTYGLLIYQSKWKIFLLLMAGGFLAVIANGLRIIGIVTYDYFSDTRLTMEQHSWFEMPALLLCFSILFWVFSRLRPEDLSLDSRVAQPAPGSLTTNGILWSLLAAMLFSLPPLLFRETNELIESPATKLLHQENLASWKWVNKASDWQPGSRSGSVITSTGVYENLNQKISLFIAKPVTHRAKVSGAAIDLNSEGWMPSEGKTLSTCQVQDCVDYFYNKFLLKGSDRVRHVYSVYVVNGALETSTLKFRLSRAMSALQGDSPDARYIAIASENTHGLSADELAIFFHVISSQKI